MLNGNSFYGQGLGFTIQLAMAMNGPEASAPRETPATDKDNSFQRHLADALAGRENEL